MAWRTAARTAGSGPPGPAGVPATAPAACGSAPSAPARACLVRVMTAPAWGSEARRSSRTRRDSRRETVSCGVRRTGWSRPWESVRRRRPASQAVASKSTRSSGMPPGSPESHRVSTSRRMVAGLTWKWLAASWTVTPSWSATQVSRARSRTRRPVADWRLMPAPARAGPPRRPGPGPLPAGRRPRPGAGAPARAGRRGPAPPRPHRRRPGGPRRPGGRCRAR